MNIGSIGTENQTNCVYKSYIGVINNHFIVKSMLYIRIRR